MASNVTVTVLTLSPLDVTVTPKIAITSIVNVGKPGKDGAGISLTPSERAANGEIVQVIGYGINGTPDGDTQAKIDALVALGWPVDNIWWRYLGDSSSSESTVFLISANINITPQIEQVALMGQLASNDLSITPSISISDLVGILDTNILNVTTQVEQVVLFGQLASDDLIVVPQIIEAALVGLLAVDNLNITPQLDPIVLIQAGSLGVNDLSITPQISQVDLVGVLPVDDLSITLQLGQLALTGLLPVDNASVTPQIDTVVFINSVYTDDINITPNVDIVSFVGALNSDNVSVTPNIDVISLVGGLTPDSVTITPSVDQSVLVGVLPVDGLSVTPQVEVAILIGKLAVDDISVTPQVSSADLTVANILATNNISITPQVGQVALIGVLSVNNVSVTPQVGAAELTAAGGGGANYNITDFELSRDNWIDIGQYGPTDSGVITGGYNSTNGYRLGFSDDGEDPLGDTAILKTFATLTNGTFSMRAKSESGTAIFSVYLDGGSPSVLTNATVGTSWTLITGTISGIVAGSSHDLVIYNNFATSGVALIVDDIKVPIV